ncbi:MAG: hydantoinase B/oxoprolinase family protein [Nitriliruptoraceae bacterium]
MLPPKTTLRLRRGDRLIVETPGGGGYGPPDDR